MFDSSVTFQRTFNSSLCFESWQTGKVKIVIKSHRLWFSNLNKLLENSQIESLYQKFNHQFWTWRWRLSKTIIRLDPCCLILEYPESPNYAGVWFIRVSRFIHLHNNFFTSFIKVIMGLSLRNWPHLISRKAFKFINVLCTSNRFSLKAEVAEKQIFPSTLLWNNQFFVRTYIINCYSSDRWNLINYYNCTTNPKINIAKVLEGVCSVCTHCEVEIRQNSIKNKCKLTILTFTIFDNWS